MNCLDFRRTLAAEPARESAELREHLLDCAPCAEFAQQMRSLDLRIERALRVPVPARSERLPAGASSTWATRPWALAASVLVAVAAASVVWLAFPRASLAKDIVTHAHHEPESWAAQRPEIPRSVLTRLLRDSGLDADRHLGGVSYARSCWFRGHFVPHLVVQDQGESVMVLVLTEEAVTGRTQFVDEGYAGVIMPARRGGIAVLAPDAERADAVAARVLQALQ